jgi:carboxymethylenebutenolidase
MPTTRTQTVTTADGREMSAHVAVPDAGAGPGMLVLQEIFGVNDYVRDACDRLARLGYVALAPDLFHRLEPGLEFAHDDAGLEQAFANIGRFDFPQAVADSANALAALRALPEVDGRAGAFGFCLGGTLAYAVAAAADPDTAVAYYGSGIFGALEQAGAIDCPVLFHFGGQDQFIPREQVDAVVAAAGERPGFEANVEEDAGHAFDNHDAPRFHQPEAAARAWQVTEDFLGRTLAPA